MGKSIAGTGAEVHHPGLWEGLEGLAREKAPEMIQRILEEEVTHLLTRPRHAYGSADVTTGIQGRADVLKATHGG